MSRWKQKGFVLDSEEEEESQTESQSLLKDSSKERVEHDQSDRKDAVEKTEIVEDVATGSRELTNVPAEYHVSQQVMLPLKLSPVHASQQQRTESPDPLQASPTLHAQQVQGSDDLGYLKASSSSSPVSIECIAKCNGGQTTPSPTSLTARISPNEARKRKALRMNNAPNILDELGISPLSDDLEDEMLSDPPTDLESPSPPFTPVLLHRKTAVQVIIPSPAILQDQTNIQQTERNFRQRKPIQLHPYILEGEMYRREVRSRGLKPVSWEHPPNRQARVDTETQETNFDLNQNLSSSIPEPEISDSTHIVKFSRKSTSEMGSTRLRHTSALRRRPSLHHHRSPVAKRPKLNIPLSQEISVRTSIFDDNVSQHDPWSKSAKSSHSFSSSPRNKIGSAHSLKKQHTILVDSHLPTSSSSSVRLGDLQLQSSDSDTIMHAIQSSNTKVSQPLRIDLSESDSAALDSSDENERNETELKKVSKKMKGVLPASWLRFDRQAQEERKAVRRETERTRMYALDSFESAEPQRGIAKRIVKPTNQSRAPVIAHSSRIFAITSEDSDEGLGISAPFRDNETPNDVEDAIALAENLDVRYADDDLSDTEDNRLHLPVFRSTEPKRKRQTRLTSTFKSAKRPLSQYTGTIGTAAVRRPRNTTTRKHKRTQSRLYLKTLPALSIVDVEFSTRDTSLAPQFLKLARRQALKRSDLARQDIHEKQIRLNSALDTEDANLALLEWRRGILEPKNANLLLSQVSRTALVNKADKQQYDRTQQNVTAGSIRNPSKKLEIEAEHPRSGRRRTHPPGISMFRRDFVHKSHEKHRRDRSKPDRYHGFSLRRTLPLFRAAQLENEGNESGHGHEKLTFQHRLQRIEQRADILQSKSASHENLVLARYLSGGNDSVPISPKDKSQHIRERSLSESVFINRRRLVRKSKPRRIDIDAREYRQPSEPAVKEIMQNLSLFPEVESEFETNLTFLGGLGPYGTRYPVTFDIRPLVHGTYFHSSTFIGSDEFHRALLVGMAESRDLTDPAGYHSIIYKTSIVRCGPWNDQTYSSMRDLLRMVWTSLEDQAQSWDQTTSQRIETLKHLVSYLRSLIFYVTWHLSFSDSIDQVDFAAKMNNLIRDSFNQLLVTYAIGNKDDFGSEDTRRIIQSMSYLLVLALQIYQITRSQNILIDHQIDISDVIGDLSKTIIKHLVQNGVQELNTFLETNRRHDARENGIQESDVLTESTVICMHVLECITLPGMTFWSVVSKELQSTAATARHAHIFERIWATMFTFLPFIDIDRLGIFTQRRRHGFRWDDWTCIRDLLRQLFDLYPNTFGRHSGSVNEYVRAILSRCHTLVYHWHWRRPEQMLNVVFDFFSRNGLRPLLQENVLASVSYLEDLNSNPALTLLPNEASFHIALKCLTLGLQGMIESYSEKKIRSFVFRLIPNHGRTYPKDQPLDEENLTALRNHHDLLSTLYWAAPPPCRPKLDHIRHLVNHESSHREACRLNVRAWANLTAFQLSTEEPSTSALPFAVWHKDIMHQTLKQYRLAKIEADEYLGTKSLGNMIEVAAIRVRQAMEKNQEQVIATLRDCIAGMQKGLQHANDKLALRKFLIDSDIVRLLELPHLEDHRLVYVIKDALVLLKAYAARQQDLSIPELDRQIGEDSQDYGEFPDIEDWDSLDRQPLDTNDKEPSLDFIQSPLWYLLSNAFGSERLPDENLLMACIDAWICLAKITIEMGEKTWSYYVDAFSPVSWQQLRQTEQTRKFGPYFMAALIDCDSRIYKEHQDDFIKSLLLSLVERESLLRFQYRLLYAIMRTRYDHPLTKNLPFSGSEKSETWFITAETIETRRLAIISSSLSNMRDDVQLTSSAKSTYMIEARGRYAALLNDLMNTMKNNYQELRQGTAVNGAYVKFVQKIVQFLKQYTSEICPVLPFFTDSVAFPLPATDPNYVIGRLRGYESKMADLGALKQLSVFIQTVAQQAAADNQHLYLVNQLRAALCASKSSSANNIALRSSLLQGIFPAYIEVAFTSSTNFLVARPILLSLPLILDDLIFDVHITNPSILSSVARSIMSILHALVRSSEHLGDSSIFFNRGCSLSSLTHIFKIMKSSLSLLEYISSRTIGKGVVRRLPIIVYMTRFSVYVAEMISDMMPREIPQFNGGLGSSSWKEPFEELLAFCKQGLEDSIKMNWNEAHGIVWFGQGHARREVGIEIGSLEEERKQTMRAIDEFHSFSHKILGNIRHPVFEEGACGDVIV